MKTIKIIHYPESGHRTTDMFDSESVKIVEGYLSSIFEGDELDNFFKEGFPLMKFGADIPKEKASKCWVIVIYSDYSTAVACMNAEVYIMSEGKTIASYKSLIVE
jgi:hypothetical protein